MSYQRARSEEHKAERKMAILSTARNMCDEKGVMNWSLNELGKQAGFTKSNLYRYFGSREEILMVLLHEEIVSFAQAFSAQTKTRSLSVVALCRIMAQLFGERPFLCQLICVSSTVLEQNTNLAAMLKIKQAGRPYEQQVVSAIEASVADINLEMAGQIALTSGVIVAGLWPMASANAPLQKLAQQPGFEHLAMNFQEQLQAMLEAYISGLIR